MAVVVCQVPKCVLSALFWQLMALLVSHAAYLFSVHSYVMQSVVATGYVETLEMVNGDEIAQKIHSRC